MVFLEVYRMEAPEPFTYFCCECPSPQGPIDHLRFMYFLPEPRAQGPGPLACAVTHSTFEIVVWSFAKEAKVSVKVLGTCNVERAVLPAGLIFNGCGFLTTHCCGVSDLR